MLAETVLAKGANAYDITVLAIRISEGVNGSRVIDKTLGSNLTSLLAAGFELKLCYSMLGCTNDDDLPLAATLRDILMDSTADAEPYIAALESYSRK